MKTTVIGKNQKTSITEELTTQNSELEYVVNRNARLTLVLVAVKTTDIQARITIRLADRGASAQIIGIAVGKGKTSMYIQTFQHHTAPETTSNLLIRSVLCDEATFLFDGAIIVEKNAQKTDAYQRNENMMLSDAAHAESRPTLEIKADDVRCTHGATIGQVPQEALWYLASRGIGKEQATGLIASGFLEQALVNIEDISVQHKALDRIRNRL